MAAGAAVPLAQHGSAYLSKGTQSMQIAALEAQTFIHIRSIGRGIVQSYADDKRLPTPNGLTSWIQMNFRGGDQSKDNFGFAYEIEIIDGGFRLRSRGADGVRGTEDDLTYEVDDLENLNDYEVRPE